eukprot:gene7434-569_t
MRPLCCASPVVALSVRLSAAPSAAPSRSPQLVRSCCPLRCASSGGALSGAPLCCSISAAAALWCASAGAPNCSPLCGAALRSPSCVPSLVRLSAAALGAPLCCSLYMCASLLRTPLRCAYSLRLSRCASLVRLSAAPSWCSLCYPPRSPLCCSLPLPAPTLWCASMSAPSLLRPPAAPLSGRLWLTPTLPSICGASLLRVSRGPSAAPLCCDLSSGHTCAPSCSLSAPDAPSMLQTLRCASLLRLSAARLLRLSAAPLLLPILVRRLWCASGCRFWSASLLRPLLGLSAALSGAPLHAAPAACASVLGSRRRLLWCASLTAPLWWPLEVASLLVRTYGATSRLASRCALSAAPLAGAIIMVLALVRPLSSLSGAPYLHAPPCCPALPEPLCCAAGCPLCAPLCSSCTAAHSASALCCAARARLSAAPRARSLWCASLCASP